MTSTLIRNLTVWAALMVLLAGTLVSAYLPLGYFNIVVNVTIALAKAGLVMVFFMHLSESSALLRLAAAGGFLWLAFMVTLTLSDSLTRTVLTPPAP